jgi:amino acid adenylation domain-containing protein
MRVFPLTPSQESLLLASMNNEGSYVSVITYEILENISVESLMKRANKLAQDHEALRTHFIEDKNSALLQEVSDHAEVEFITAEKLTDEHTHIEPFGKCLYRYVYTGKRLHIVFHHALLDGFSIDIIMRGLMSEDETMTSPFRYYEKWLSKADKSEDLDWWRNYVGQLVPQPLPGILETEKCRREDYTFQIQNHDGLRLTARTLQITTGRLIEAVWCMLVARLEGGQAVVPVVDSGRSAPVPNILNMVGMCVNTQPIVTRLEPVPFSQWVDNWKASTNQALKHKACTISEILRNKLPHILTVTPSVANERYRQISTSAQLVSDFDVSFTLSDIITGEISFNACAYAQSQVERIAGYFQAAIRAVIENPNRIVTEIPIISEQERRLLLHIEHDEKLLQESKNNTLVHLIKTTASLYSDNAAIVCGGTSVSYQELVSRAKKIASGLIKRGASWNTPIAVLMPRNERYIISELAIMMTGAFFMPLDVSHPKERIELIIKETKPSCVIDETLYQELVEADITKLTNPASADLAYMIMTSGTTGVPKGVMIRHESILHYVLWAKSHYGFHNGDSVLSVFGYGFDGSMLDIYLPLISGGTIHIPDDDMRIRIDALGDYCRREGITHLNLPVSMIQGFLEEYGTRNLPALRHLITGGEEIRTIPKSRYTLTNEYGPTECTVCCAAGVVTGERFPAPFGTPLPNTGFYILDKWGNLCPDGIEGEAYVSGVQLAQGYFGEKTGERFVKSPFHIDGHERLYRTGDIVKWIDIGGKRQLIFVNREDTQVKVRGFRVELSEIEGVLRSHEAVSRALAVVANDNICAYVVLSKSIGISELVAFVKEKLPPYMVPVIVTVEDIPLNQSGKVDYSALPKPQLADTDFIPPVTDCEKLLITAVCEAFSVSDIGMKHNYIEIGGTSLGAMRLSLVLSHKGYELSPRDILSSEDFYELSGLMKPVARPDENETSTSAARFTPLDVQKGMIFLSKTQSRYGYTVTLRLEANGLDYATLKQRVDKAAALHDILRTTFKIDENGDIYGVVSDAHEIRICSAVSGQGIDPLNDPLVHISLSDDALTIQYHHIALDGQSIGLLADELLTGYFPEKAPSFSAFCNALSVDAEKKEQDSQWWHNYVSGARVLQLVAGADESTSELEQYEFLSGALLTQLKEKAKKLRTTPAALLMHALGTALLALNGDEGDILIPFAGTMRTDEALMGMCADVFPLRFSAVSNGMETVLSDISACLAHSYMPAEMKSRLPKYLFVYEDSTGFASTFGNQDYKLVFHASSSGRLLYDPSGISDEAVRLLSYRIMGAISGILKGSNSVFSEEEYEKVTRIFPYGDRVPLPCQGLTEILETSMKEHGTRIAVETLHQSLTYSEIFFKAKKLAEELSVQGVGTGDIVAVRTDRNEGAVIAPVAALLSGASFLPIDLHVPHERVEEILSDSRAAAVIDDNGNITFTGNKAELTCDAAYVIYTSGTTGVPKGVVITKEALKNLIMWCKRDCLFSESDKFLHYISLSFDPSILIIFSALYTGASVVLVPDDMRLDYSRVLSYIREKDVTVCILPAAIAPHLLSGLEGTSVRQVQFGGEAPRNIHNGAFERINVYGPTEACVIAACYRMNPSETETNIVGRPILNTSCFVIDKEGNPCPVGVRGELCIGGIQVMAGYLNRPEETDRVFIDHERFGKLYRTGDIVSWTLEGALRFYGRNDSQVKILGNRVELLEIEVTLQKLDGIREAVVKVTDAAIDAYVTWETGKKTLSYSDIVKALSKRLPKYMIPRSVTTLDAFPMTPNGKIDKQALKPPPILPASTGEQPKTKAEKILAQVWHEILELPDDIMIKRNDNFLYLGGSSLLLFGVMGKLKTRGFTVDLNDLVENLVLCELASTIEAKHIRKVHEKVKDDAKKAAQYRKYLREVQGVDVTRKRQMKNVLITGGTGFLGSFFIREMYMFSDAHLHLPVRGHKERLKESLESYFGAEGLAIYNSDRVSVYCADISEEGFAPAILPDAIFHIAADIRHYAPYNEMYRANVTATENMIELAKRKSGTLLCHFSTISAVNHPIIRETDTNLGTEFLNVYQRTKQIAENRVFSASRTGLDYMIFRLGHISPSLENADLARNADINATLRILKAMYLTGALPAKDQKIGFGFVDQTAKAMRLLSEQERLTNRVFHIDNPNTVRLSEIFTSIERAFVILPRSEMTKRMKELATDSNDTIRKAAIELLGRTMQSDIEKDTTDIVTAQVRMKGTLTILEKLGFRWSYADEGYLLKLFEKLMENTNI